MDIRQLHYFLVLCEEMNYTRAAQRLFLSRQALRQSISALEAELCGPLFLSAHHKLSLTERGVSLQRHAAPVLPVPETLPGRRYVVLDGVQDPGNVGTVLRTLDAFDADGLLLTGGCADPFGPKTVRASMGAVFRRPVWSVTPEELGDLLRRSGIPLYGAALRPDAMDARQADYSRCALAIGSEGRGLSREVLDLCDKTVLIPMSPRCESLNAAIAAAVLLWESWR